NASFIFTAPNGAITGPVITATATDPAYNTSEFSACTTVVGLFRTIQLSAAAYTVAEGGHVDVTITRTTDTSDSASVSLATISGDRNDRGQRSCEWTEPHRRTGGLCARALPGFPES